MGTVAKAIMGAVTGGSGALVVALADNGITAVEYVGVVSTVLVAFFGVWATTNTPASEAK